MRSCLRGLNMQLSKGLSTAFSGRSIDHEDILAGIAAFSMVYCRWKKKWQRLGENGIETFVHIIRNVCFVKLEQTTKGYQH